MEIHPLLPSLTLVLRIEQQIVISWDGEYRVNTSLLT